MKIRELFGVIICVLIIMNLSAVIAAPPQPPHIIWGFVKNNVGTGINEAQVTLTNQRTGDYITTSSFYDNFSGAGNYVIDIAELTNGWIDGDNLTIYASKVGVGYNLTWTIANASLGAQQLDIILTGDETPPITQLNLGSPSYVGTYITSATLISLSATDDLSGVNTTLYRIWNGVWSGWTMYTTPFTIPEACTHYAQYYSVDNADNIEITHNVTLSVDNIPPVADAGSDQEGIVGQILTFDASSSYDVKSGIATYMWEFGDGALGYGAMVTHSYGGPGIYQLNLTVTDHLGLSNTDSITVTISLPYENFTFALKTGWNLICLPLDTNYITGEALGAAIGADTIAKWNPVTQQWIVHPIGGPFNFALEDGISYFVHVTVNSSFQIQGLPFATITYSYYTGWNFIGWVSSTPTTAELFGATISGCDSVVSWRADLQQWVSHPVGGPFNFAITRGMGVPIHKT